MAIGGERLEVRVIGNIDDIKRKLSQAQKDVRQFSGEVGSGMRASADATGILGNELKGLAARLLSVYAAWKALGEAKEIVQTGVRFNAELETSRLGIASLITTYGRVIDSQGQVLEGAKAFNAATQIAIEFQDKLKVAALQTAGNYSDLLRAVQEGIGPAITAGITGTDQLVQFSQRMAQIAGAMGMDFSQLGQEIRGIFEVDLSRHSRIAKALFSGMGMSAEELRKKMKELGDEGKLFDFLMEKMAGFEIAGKQLERTFSGAFSNLQDVWEQALGAATEDTTKRLTQAVLDLAGSIVTFDKEGKAVFNENFLELVEGMADAFSDMAEFGSKLANLTIKEGGYLDTLKTLMELIREREGKGLKQDLFGFGNISPGQVDTYVGYEPGFGSVRKPIVEVPFDQTPAGRAMEWMRRFGMAPSAERPADALGNLNRDMGTMVLNARALSGYLGDAGKEVVSIERNVVDSNEALEKTTESVRKAAREFRTLRLETSRYFGGFTLAEHMRGTPGVQGAGELRELQSIQIAADHTARIVKGIADEGARVFADRTSEQLSIELERVGEQFARNFSIPAGDMLADFALTGGENFGKIAGEMFNRLTVEGADSFIAALSSLLGGKITEQGGKFIFGGRSFDTRQEAEAARLQSSPGLQGLGAAFQFGAIGVGSYQGGQQGMSIGEGAISGALAGGSIGWVGAAVGAIIGAAGAYLGGQSASDKHRFTIPHVERGFGESGIFNVLFERATNLPKAELEKMRAQILDVVYQTWNGYVELLLKMDLPIPQFEKIVGRVEEGGRPSADFYQRFDEWVNGTLPDLLADQFADEIGEGFQGLGLSETRWNTLWRMFDSIDPKKALSLMSTLADALIDMQEAADFFGRTERRGFGGTVGGDLGAMGRVRTVNTSFEFALQQAETEMGMSFAERLRDSDTEILKLADSLEHLVGEGQIQAASELAQLMQNRMELEKEHARQMVQMAQQVNRQYDALLRDLELAGLRDAEGKPDYDAQLQFLQDYADEALRQMTQAGTLEELNYWNQEYINTIQRMLGVAGEVGPNTAEAYRIWAIENLERGRNIFNEHMKTLAEEISEANNRLWLQVQDAWNRFIGLLDSVGENEDDDDDDNNGRDSEVDDNSPPNRGAQKPIGWNFPDEGVDDVNSQFIALNATLTTGTAHVDAFAAAVANATMRLNESGGGDGTQELIIRIQDPLNYVKSVQKRRLAG